MLDKIKPLVEFAYENVPLYRKLYRHKPEITDMENFRRLPRITRNDFALCGIEDVISDMDEATIILPPIENQTIFPFPRLECSDDRDVRYEVFYSLMKQVGVMDGVSFLVITDTPHSYYCGEVASNLLYYGHPTWMMLLRDHPAGEIRSWIEKFEPDCLFLGLDRIPEAILGCGVPSIFTINHYDRDFSTDKVNHFDIYALTEVGWMGIRPPSGQYMYPTEYFRMEADPADGILTLTALESWLQPFIRYKTSDRGGVPKDGTFQVTYIGEH